MNLVPKHRVSHSSAAPRQRRKGNMADKVHNRMEVQAERISPKQVVITVDLYSDLADTAFLTLDDTQSQTATLEDGHVQLEFPLSDEQSRLHLHTVTAEFFSGENPASVGALEREITT